MRGERCVFVRGQSGRVIELDLKLGGVVNSYVSRLWLLLDADGKAVVKLNRRAWDPDELEGLRTRLGVERQVVSSQLSASAAEERYPGLVPFWARHSTATGVLLTLVLIVVIVLVSSLL